MSNRASIFINNCIECHNHEVLPDPDPDDWFCSDDVKVFCKRASKYITVACRPYATETECSIPNWCPILDNISE